MKHFLNVAHRLDDHWDGDLLGAICLFATAYSGLLVGFGAGLK